MTMNLETLTVDTVLTSAQFAELYKVTGLEMSDLVTMGIIPSRGTLQQMAGAYLGHLQRRLDSQQADLDSRSEGGEGLDSAASRLAVSAHLDFPCTQAEFGKLVDLSQAAVSGLIKRGVLRPNGTALTWWRDYVQHLEEQAQARRAGRGAR